MKKVILLFLFSIVCQAQVGINTTSPTNTLDVDGGLRVRNLNNGTVESDVSGNLNIAPYQIVAMGVVDRTGTIWKGFGATAVRINNTRYRITFSTTQVDNDYLINLTARNKNASYENPTTNTFEVIIENPSSSGTFDFNFVVYKITN